MAVTLFDCSCRQLVVKRRRVELVFGGRAEFPSGSHLGTFNPVLYGLGMLLIDD